MSTIVIHGRRPLSGEVTVQGSKNAVLPILAATVLNGGENVIHRCPRLRDVEGTVKILRHLGCDVRWEGNTLLVDSRHIDRCDIPDCLMRSMRSSVIFLGAITARCGEATISMPGGCDIGKRPIDLHLKAFREMGIAVEEQEAYISAKANGLQAKKLHLTFPSVGATENVMLAATAAEGETVIYNAAKEPEIVDLANFLKAIGVRVEGAGTDVIRMSGAKRLSPCAFTVMSDRIVAATYLTAALMTKSDLWVRYAEPAHLEAVLEVIKKAGGTPTIYQDGIRLLPPQRVRAVEKIKTEPYPGFPTDAQSLFLAAMSVADGVSVMEETIFENRFKTVPYLRQMGADIKQTGQMAIVRGVPNLCGASVKAPDLRGGAAILLAALAAEGETVIADACHIDRGYEDICVQFESVGADIKRMEQ